MPISAQKTQELSCMFAQYAKSLPQILHLCREVEAIAILFIFHFIQRQIRLRRLLFACIGLSVLWNLTYGLLHQDAPIGKPLVRLL